MEAFPKQTESVEREKIVMKKVGDILNGSTAFHHLSGRVGNYEEVLEKIFQYGITGAELANEVESKETYRNKIRSIQHYQPSVYFNIYGRVVPTNKDSKDDHLNRISGSFNNGIAILFDVPLKESFGEENAKYGFSNKIGEYSFAEGFFFEIIALFRKKYPDIQPNDPRIMEFIRDRLEKEGIDPDGPYEDKGPNWKYAILNHFTPDGQTRVSSIGGFKTPFRVAPRKFKGIVIDMDRLDNTTPVSDRIESILNLLKDIPSEDLVPIYDPAGNLLWPEEISHEEIVKMKENQPEGIE